MNSLSSSQCEFSIDAFDNVIFYSWGVIAFRGRYRFPLFELFSVLAPGQKPTILSLDLLSSHLLSIRRRADFYWLLLRGMVSLGDFPLDASEKSILYLKSINLSAFAALLSTTIYEVESSMGLDRLSTYVRSLQLSRYGFCAKANPAVLEDSSAGHDLPNERFFRSKLPSSRTGEPASPDQCMQLLRSVLRKQQRKSTFEGYPLFRRAMPSSGSLCCIEAVLLSGWDCWLYDSLGDRFLNLPLAANAMSAIHSDLWLNLGNVQHVLSSAILLFAVQNPHMDKYGEISDQLQSIDAGLVLADMWQFFSLYGLRGCILGNPMSGPLIAHLRTYLGDVLPVCGIMIFEGRAAST